MINKIVFFVILIIAPTVLFAQKVKISGTVYDFDNKPIDFVLVTQKGSLTPTFTNFKGQYQISANKGDSITVVFTLMGYQTTERTIVPIGNTTLNIMMRESSTELGELVVEGQKKQTSSVQNIEVGKTALLADPTGGSIENIIKGELGVSNTNELSSQYSVRGGSYDENIVYVNGIEVYRPLLIRSGQQEGLSFINPNMTGKVGFSSGGFDASYGDKMSSVLDITYKKPKEFEAAASASLLGVSAYVGSAGKRFTQVTGVRYKTAKNLLGTTDMIAVFPSMILPSTGICSPGRTRTSSPT